MSEDILWFWAVLFFTVPPVLRFRENFLVPSLAMLLTFGFYTQAYWMPDFYYAGDWPRILGICLSILIFYYICGFIIHFIWFKGKSENLRKFGSFTLLLKAWFKGKYIIYSEDYITEIRRFKLIELKWENINRIEQFHERLVLSDDLDREPEHLSEISVNVASKMYADIESQLIKRKLI